MIREFNKPYVKNLSPDRKVNFLEQMRKEKKTYSEIAKNAYCVLNMVHKKSRICLV